MTQTIFSSRLAVWLAVLISVLVINACSGADQSPVAAPPAAVTTAGAISQKTWSNLGNFAGNKAAAVNGQPLISYPAVEVVFEPVSAGTSHTCARRPDSSVVCWGDNYFGQLGSGTTVAKTTPVAVNGLTDVVAISAGGYHTCALKANGRVACWGSNDSGQLGDGTVLDKTTPVAVVRLTNVVALSAGGYYTCALKANGSLVCWGHDSDYLWGGGTAGAGSSIPLPLLTPYVQQPV
jgi:alpha-tubulin suppressor-like RCC1 family protein